MQYKREEGWMTDKSPEGVETRDIPRSSHDEAGFRAYVAGRQGLGPVKQGPAAPLERRYGGGRRGDSEATGEAFERFQAARPLFVCALDTGLSRSDLINLDWQQVDLENRLIRTACTETGVPVTIPMTKRLLAELQAIGPHPAGTLVFRTVAGGRWAEAMIKRYFKTAKTLAGITRPFRFHDMRHDFASSLAQEGVSLYVIAQLLGHTSTQMTMGYAHLHPANLRAAIDSLPGR